MFEINEKYSMTFPYEIGTLIELKSNSNILAEIRQYRVTVENDKERILVGLSFEVYKKNPNLEFEITMDNLKSNWKKTNQIILKENIGTKLNLGSEFDSYAKTLKLFK